MAVKIRYYARENTKLGTHSFYAQPLPNGTLDFKALCDEACENTSIEPSIMLAAVSDFMKTARRNLLKGFRVEIGEKFLTLYPNLSASVKDQVDKDGNVLKAATAQMLTAANAKSRVGATVNADFSAEFARSVAWQKTDATGATILDDDDATKTNEEQQGDDNSNSGNQGGGSGNEPDDDSNEG